MEGMKRRCDHAWVHEIQDYWVCVKCCDIGKPKSRGRYLGLVTRLPSAAQQEVKSKVAQLKEGES